MFNIAKRSGSEATIQRRIFETPAEAGVCFLGSENAEWSFLLLAVPSADIDPA